MNFKDFFQLMIILLMNRVSLANNVNDTKSCEVLHTEQCEFESECSRNSIAILRACKTLVVTGYHEAQCSLQCQRKLKEFITKEFSIGYNIMSSCDCNADTRCIIYRKRFKNCLNNVTMVTTQGCKHYLKQCRKSKSCFKLYGDWFNHCGSLISGYQCTPKCVQIEKKLHAHRIGQHLKTCQCNGYYEEEKFCLDVRYNRKHLCSVVNDKEENETKGRLTILKSTYTKSCSYMLTLNVGVILMLCLLQFILM